ncbi:MAG: bifunctional folylpolyglutamate synthase/dihydrofolate synthase [Planctomycetia bacterium]
MTAKRKDRAGLTRAESLAWLERRVNYERAMPASSTGSFGLARMRRLLAAIGAPHERLPVVHVAGTKGKGSTVAMIAAILAESGHKVGAYLSPHVHAIEERISVRGRPISAAALVAAFATVIPAVDAMDRAAERRGGRGPTWFEVMTAVAMLHFARERVDIAVLETGLGGRLDATNVSRPVLCVITSISLDHMAILGPTIGRIATEKAGIIKRGIPVISGATAPAARRVIAATAARRRAPLLQLGRDFHATHVSSGGAGAKPLGNHAVVVELPGEFPTTKSRLEPSSYSIGMPGVHQAANAALAVVAAHKLDVLGYRVPPRAIAAGLKNTLLPARVQVLSKKPLVVVDAAHNVASMEALLEALAGPLDAFSPRVLLFAASADKQLEKMLAAAAGRFDHVVITRYATNPRAAPVERLAAACESAGLPKPRAAASPRDALKTAKKLAGRSGMVCVAGSFFLAAEIDA